MLDVTLSLSLRGMGLGKGLKYALFALAQAKGVEKINGRNRDRLAKDMINVNLSLGSYEQFFIQEDYPDFEEYRDVLYYTSDTCWKSPKLNLIDGINSPNGTQKVETDFCLKNMPTAINKVCLSNFVSRDFLTNMKFCLDLLPTQLQHGYSTSGQSECVDKLVKTIWVNKKKSNRLLTFKGHFFGSGSFLARTLSDELDPYFPVTHLNTPDESNWKEIILDVENEIKKNSPLGIWIEPILQKLLTKTPREFLLKLRELCSKNDIPLIYNETASAFYRYGDQFFASNDSEIAPDAGMVYLGGQSGLVFTNENNFLSKPLMMISTWDGDELSFAKFVAAAQSAINDESIILSEQQKFDLNMKKYADSHGAQLVSCGKGYGHIEGSLPVSHQSAFQKVGNRFYFLPSIDTLKSFNKKGFN